MTKGQNTDEKRKSKDFFNIELINWRKGKFWRTILNSSEMVKSSEIVSTAHLNVTVPEGVWKILLNDWTVSGGFHKSSESQGAAQQILLANGPWWPKPNTWGLWMKNFAQTWYLFGFYRAGRITWSSSKTFWRTRRTRTGERWFPTVGFLNLQSRDQLPSSHIGCTVSEFNVNGSQSGCISSNLNSDWKLSSKAIFFVLNRIYH